MFFLKKKLGIKCVLMFSLFFLFYKTKQFSCPFKHKNDSHLYFEGVKSHHKILQRE